MVIIGTITVIQSEVSFVESEMRESFEFVFLGKNHLRAGDVEVAIFVVTDDTVVKHESSLMRTHLLCRKVPLPGHMEDGQL